MIDFGKLFQELQSFGPRPYDKALNEQVNNRPNEQQPLRFRGSDDLRPVNISPLFDDFGVIPGTEYDFVIPPTDPRYAAYGGGRGKPKSQNPVGDAVGRLMNDPNVSRMMGGSGADDFMKNFNNSRRVF